MRTTTRSHEDDSRWDNTTESERSSPAARAASGSRPRGCSSLTEPAFWSPAAPGRRWLRRERARRQRDRARKRRGVARRHRPTCRSGAVRIRDLRPPVRQCRPNRLRAFESMTEAVYDQLLAVNAKGAYFTVQKLAPLMIEGGAVILTTSIADVKGFALASAYSASKAALRSMAPLACARASAARHPRQRGKPGSHRYPDHRQGRAKGCGRPDQAPIARE